MIRLDLELARGAFTVTAACRKISRASVRVPGTLGATITVAPNSPSARANASTAPERMPGKAKGRVTRVKVRQGSAPRVRAADSRPGSTASTESRTERTRNGRPTTAPARAMPSQVKTISNRKRSKSSPPTKPLRPKITSRK